MRPLLVGALIVAALNSTARADDETLIPMTFAHADHREQNCIRCHHDFADATGYGLCIDCHTNDPDLRPLLETQFHDLCRGCHVARRREGDEAGPTRACFDCHHSEELP